MLNISKQSISTKVFLDIFQSINRNYDIPWYLQNEYISMIFLDSYKYNSSVRNWSILQKLYLFSAVENYLKIPITICCSMIFLAIWTSGYIFSLYWNFLQSCRPFQMPNLLENIREIGSFKVTAECLVEMALELFTGFLQGLPCHLNKRLYQANPYPLPL